MKIIELTITETGDMNLDIGAGTHGADCADITEGFAAALGTVTADGWRAEENCKGNCAGCEFAFLHRRSELRSNGCQRA